MKVVVLHPTGNRNVRAVIKGLSERGMLAEFHTTLAANPHASWLKLLPSGIRSEWLRRTYSLPSEQIWTHAWLEFARMTLPRIGLNHFVRHEAGFASIDAVYRDIDQAAASRLCKIKGKKAVNAVYAYEDGSLALFTQAKQLGLTCIYDLPIAFWETSRKLMLEESERLPKWATTLGGGVQDSAAKLERKTKELELADVVICPGQFVLESLPVWARKKHLIVVPFGSPQVIISKAENKNEQDAKANRPLRVLFAGSMGQRKGLGDLFAAVKLLNRLDLELVVMGSPLAPIEFYRKEIPDFTYEPGRPYEEVLKLMRSCDVFCLPSIVEGRALVMQEAMSQGLPLIITANTGGADLIIEGETGFLVPIRSPEAIAAKLAWFLDNRSEIPRMSELARLHAARYTWESYGANIVALLSKLLE